MESVGTEMSNHRATYGNGANMTYLNEQSVLRNALWNQIYHYDTVLIPQALDAIDENNVAWYQVGNALSDATAALAAMCGAAASCQCSCYGSTEWIDGNGPVASQRLSR